jgi:hypothetical protein
LILYRTERLENDFGSNPYIMKPTTALYNLICIGIHMAMQFNSIQYNMQHNTMQCSAK